MVQRILATNVVLANMGVEKDVTCSFCGKERDAIEHIFLRCEHVKRFWEQLQTVVNNACANGLFVNLNESIILFGHDCSFKSDDTFDLIILLAKFFIYKCKVKKNIPQFHLFINYLKTAFEAYTYIAIINMSYDKFTKEWQFYKTLMESQTHCGGCELYNDNVCVLYILLWVHLHAFSHREVCNVYTQPW